MIALFKRLTLANPAEEIFVVGKISIDSRIIAEVVDFPEAEEIESFDRGNLQKQIAFMATRQHSSEDAAELFANTHDEEILGKDVLTLRGGGDEWLRLYNAICLRCSTAAEGVATFSSYEFVTGRSLIKK